ncbi:MAG: dioxygenase [Gammaproteobacteria bacterium]|jgi:carotenoid cleavage dioxygenase-like enzyme|nr:dioxygenase [Gammaproteobacteria bacterium]|tara:strand:- start:528 stop:1871 length:1344 start_codon:yes stop_codon:yes gene_type:complete
MTDNSETPPAHLSGNGRPVVEETFNNKLNVTGSIPAVLDGQYMRNGSNPYTGTSAHPFLGDGMIHAIKLRDGEAHSYRNRYIQTPFIEDPSLNIMDPSVVTNYKASKANTHIIGHAGKFLALEEGHFPYEIDGELNTLGPTDFNGALTGSFTAHPKICPITGEMLAFGYSAFPPYLRYLRVSPTGELVQSEQITVGGPTMMHDFNITNNYIIFMDLPAVFDLEMAMRGELPIRWDDNYPARLGVMPRTGNDAQVTWYDINPCYVFHPMNAFEEEDKIILDVARYSHIWRESNMDFPSPNLWRWSIDTTKKSVTETQLDDRPAEFPRVADRVVGQKYRYGYMMSPAGNRESNNSTSAILKYDNDHSKRKQIELRSGITAGEPVFVPSENSKFEDDGFLMTYIYDATSDQSQFVIYDAATMDSNPIASIDLPRIPDGFHGSWIPSAVAH